MFIRNKETTMKKVLLYALVAVAAAACASKETQTANRAKRQYWDRDM